MGKYIRKFKGIEEIAVMDVAQVGVRTRARGLAMEAAVAESSGPAKKIKVGGGELEFSSSLVQLKSHRQLPENSVSEGYSTAPKNQCSSPSSDQVPASCCSSNGSTEVSIEELNFADLEEESLESETATYTFDCRGRRREISPLSELVAETGELESTAKPSEANSRRQSTAEKMPSEAEVEEFFAVAEKDLQKQFMDKYNYDIAKDQPSEGRYEWVRLKQ